MLSAGCGEVLELELECAGLGDAVPRASTTRRKKAGEADKLSDENKLRGIPGGGVYGA